jgi:hypothetical protein
MLSTQWYSKEAHVLAIAAQFFRAAASRYVRSSVGHCFTTSTVEVDTLHGISKPRIWNKFKYKNISFALINELLYK